MRMVKLLSKILITSPIRQDKETLAKYLESLNNLEIGNFTIDKLFYLHNCYEELKSCFDDKTTLYNYEDDSKDVKNDITHQWYINNLNAISKMKNDIIKYSLKMKYDYTFFVDSDLILHPKTLVHLHKNLQAMREYIMSEVFWTEWQKDSGAFGSNGWDYDSYNGDQEKFRKKGIFRVGGTGACILIDNKVFGYPNVNYSPIYNISFSEWEDRAFCIRLAVNGIKIFMDTHYPAEHLYR